MFGIILSALNSVIGWIFRSIVIKFGLFFALFFVTTEFTGFVASLVPESSSVTGLFGNIAAGTWYFLDVFSIGTGMSLVISAYATRFIIRRLPIIG